MACVCRLSVPLAAKGHRQLAVSSTMFLMSWLLRQRTSAQLAHTLIPAVERPLAIWNPLVTLALYQAEFSRMYCWLKVWLWMSRYSMDSMRGRVNVFRPTDGNSIFMDRGPHIRGTVHW